MSDIDQTLLLQNISSKLSRLERGQVSGLPPDGGSMEPRIAKLESDVDHIQDDIQEIKKDLRTLLTGGVAAFVITWAGLITSALGLAYLMAKGFHWL